MLCTMCMHGTTQTWKCDQCGETHCWHIRTCSCGNTYRVQYFREKRQRELPAEKSARQEK